MSGDISEEDDSEEAYMNITNRLADYQEDINGHEALLKDLKRDYEVFVATFLKMRREVSTVRKLEHSKYIEQFKSGVANLKAELANLKAIHQNHDDQLDVIDKKDLRKTRTKSISSRIIKKKSTREFLIVK